MVTQAKVNTLKILKKASKENGQEPKAFVDEVSENFKNLTKNLGIINTDFIRTTEERHKVSASYFWNKLCENNQIYKILQILGTLVRQLE